MESGATRTEAITSSENPAGGSQGRQGVQLRHNLAQLLQRAAAFLACFDMGTSDDWRAYPPGADPAHRAASARCDPS